MHLEKECCSANILRLCFYLADRWRIGKNVLFELAIHQILEFVVKTIGCLQKWSISCVFYTNEIHLLISMISLKKSCLPSFEVAQSWQNYVEVESSRSWNGAQVVVDVEKVEIKSTNVVGRCNFFHRRTVTDVFSIEEVQVTRFPPRITWTEFQDLKRPPRNQQVTDAV